MHTTKKTKVIITSILAAYFLFCGYLVWDSGIFNNNSCSEDRCILLQATAAKEPNKVNLVEDKEAIAKEQPSLTTAAFVPVADKGEAGEYILGADDPNTEDPETGFKLQLKLSTKGAAIHTATFTDGNDNGFDDRDHNNPQPFKLLQPVSYSNGTEILSMSNREFVFVDQKMQIRLNNINWQCPKGVEAGEGGSEKVAFVAEIEDEVKDASIIRITKTYSLSPKDYMAKCEMMVENVSATEQKVRFNMSGPVGTSREGIRTDMRKTVGAYLNNKNEFGISKKAISGGKPCFLGGGISVKASIDNYNKAKSLKRKALESGDKLEIQKANREFEIAKQNLSIGCNLSKEDKGSDVLWCAVTNKYFAAILVPFSEKGTSSNWIRDSISHFYNPDGDEESKSGDEAIGISIEIKPTTLGPKGLTGSIKKFSFDIYLGPKDKRLFDDTPYYKKFKFLYTIDFSACCCPSSIIRPLAFFILWLMNGIYAGIPNYGVAIIILVVLVRTVLHPLTKSGQIRMTRFSKVMGAPEVQEIKKKYSGKGKNQVEMQKKISEFTKSKGVSPLDALFGMMPMMLQMPLWIALWSSVNSSVDLRGAAFLPFWITDLSAPDALFRFSTITLPFFSWKISSFNLLPILMGVAFYLQQKTMPQNAAATPEQQQQQKIMKYMMLIMFPIMLYSAPSGVNLYIMASSFAGAYEQYVIRKHIREKEEEESRGLVEVTSKTGGKVKKKKPKPFYKNM